MSRNSNSNDRRQTGRESGVDEPDERGDRRKSDASTLTRRNFAKASTALALGAGLGSQLGTVAADTMPTPRLHVEGNYLADPDGNRVVLRGVNIEDPYYIQNQNPEPSLEWHIDTATNETEDWYSRVIRIPAHPHDPDLIGSAGGYEAYINDYMRPAVDMCAQRDAYAIVDCHLVSSQRDWTDPGVDADVREFWDHMAPEFADDEHVLFELYNEPTEPFSDDLSLWEDWRQTAQPWVDHVREYAPETPIIVGSPRWTSLTKYANDSPFSGNDLLYSAHIYPTHLDDYDMNALAAAADDVAMIMSEWGYINDSSQHEHMVGTTSGYGEDMKAWFESNPNVNWTSWCFGGHYQPVMLDSDDGYRVLGTASSQEYEDYQGEFVREFLYEKRTDDLPSSSGSGDGTAAPAPPENLSSPSNTDTTVDLDWDASPDGANHYNVYVDGAYDHQVGGATTSTTVDGLSPDTSYDFHATAVDADGNESDPSNTVTVTTDAGDSGGTDGGLLVNDYDGDPAWSGENDLGNWCGAGSFANGGGEGEVVDGALRLEYDSGGWFQSYVQRDVSEYTYVTLRIRGDAGGEESEVALELGDSGDVLANLTDDTIGTSFSTVSIDLAANGLDTSPEDVYLDFWQGDYVAGAVEIDEIRFE